MRRVQAREIFKANADWFSSVSIVIAVWEVFQASVDYVILSSVISNQVSRLSMLHTESITVYEKSNCISSFLYLFKI